MRGSGIRRVGIVSLANAGLPSPAFLLPLLPTMLRLQLSSLPPNPALLS